MDISEFFDNMSHDLLLKAVDRHVKKKWAKMYIKRWLESPIEDKGGNIRYRNRTSTPQGGVISPLLANLFLHYTLDKWLGIKYPQLRFVRDADDAIIHCNNQAQAEIVLQAIKQRMIECGLEVNEKKTKIAYCKNANRKGNCKSVKFDFLGFTFQPRPTSTKDGQMFLGFSCAISTKSKKKIIEVLRKSNFQRWTRK